jgi:Predicted Fe-S-cluster redox enzyme
LVFTHPEFAFRFFHFLIETRSPPGLLSPTLVTLPFYVRASPHASFFLLTFSFFLFLCSSRLPREASLTGIILEELADFLRERGAPSYRAKQITDWIYKKRVASFER